MKKIHFSVLGIITGFANGLFGSGGGIIAVPMLQRDGMPAKKAHATSISLTLPLSVVSLFLYAQKNTFKWGDTWLFVPAGLAGAAVGSFFLKKIPNALLRKIFGIFLIIAGVRMLLA